ncbi:MAG: sensor histidine kinase [Proteobacteria bacterium]|nr:sensor histidine kinase [Pseudomonadota bacterium]
MSRQSDSLTAGRREADCGAGEPLHAGDPPRLRAAPGSPLLPGLEGRWRASNLIWLIYSVSFFIEPLQRGSRGGWLVFAAIYASFLAIYLPLIFSRSRRTRGLLLAALAVLGAACYPMNPSAGGGMFIYVAAFGPFAAPSFAIAAGTIAAAALISAAEGLLLHLSPWAWGGLSFLAAAVGTGNLLQALRMSATQRLLLAQEQIEHLAKVAERERIARDLHDVLGHTLSVVVLKSELAGKLIGADAQRARQEIGEVERIARQALGEVREAIRGYRTEGIAAEIARARRALDAAGVRLECQPRSLRLEAAHESVLSLVLREAVTNILRHAGATSCRLELAADSGGTHLTVHDNGRGAGEYAGNGLRGMRERVEALGGRLEIRARQGTCLMVDIPAPAGALMRNHP